mgnify:FL=1
MENMIKIVKFKKHDPNAVIPKKAGKHEVGFDLTCIKLKKKIGEKTSMFDTGISVQPPNGYYTEIIPRSSIVKTGYILSNNTGIIDPTYRGTLKICLTKIDDTLPDLKLPFVKFQLVLRKFILAEGEEVFELTETERGEGGFGSTDKEWAIPYMDKHGYYKRHGNPDFKNTGC